MWIIVYRKQRENDLDVEVCLDEERFNEIHDDMMHNSLYEQVFAGELTRDK